MVKTYPEPQPGRPKSPDCCHMGTPENKLPDQTQGGTDTVSLRHSTTSFPSGSASQDQRTCSFRGGQSRGKASILAGPVPSSPQSPHRLLFSPYVRRSQNAAGPHNPEGMPYPTSR